MNLIANYKNRKILYDLSLDEFIEVMKNPSITHKKIVDLARGLERKSEEYQNIKASLPCIVFTFQHDKIVKGSTVIEPTGYLYLDVDEEEIDTRLYNNRYITAIWKSLSGKGYAILVKVKGITKTNLKEVSESLARELDIPYDNKAVSIDRLHIIGYDKEIYYNSESEEYVIKGSKVVINSIETDIRVKYEYTNNRLGRKSVKLRFNNLDEIIKRIDFNGEVFIDMKENKLDFFSVFVPSVISSGGRNVILFSITSGLHKLNLDLSLEDLKTLILNINRRSVKPPLPETEVFAIVTKVYGNNDKTLIPNNTRRILFNPDYEIGNKEKQLIRNRAIGQGKKDDNDKKISDVIDNWDFSNGKITQVKIAKILGLSTKTLNRREGLKEYIKKQNERMEGTKED